MFLKEDIHRLISNTEHFLIVIWGLRYTGLEKVNFFCGTPGILYIIIYLIKNQNIYHILRPLEHCLFLANFSYCSLTDNEVLKKSLGIGSVE